MAPWGSARDAYDRFAPVYDEVNAQNDYEMWLGAVLLPELEKQGLQTGWALDVGCGTGRAFVPLLDRGWQLVGCDVSPAMLDQARHKFGTKVPLLHIDARNLGSISPAQRPGTKDGFDLILLLNDVVNYMVDDGDLERVFAGIWQNLCRNRGLALFDANTLALFREAYTSGAAEEMRDRGLEWRGLASKAEPEAVYEARISGSGVEDHLHRQRHWAPHQVTEALEKTGLRCCAALGQREEKGRVILSDPPDEDRDAKVIYIASHVP